MTNKRRNHTSLWSMTITNYINILSTKHSILVSLSFVSSNGKFIVPYEIWFVSLTFWLLSAFFKRLHWRVDRSLPNSNTFILFFHVFSVLCTDFREHLVIIACFHDRSLSSKATWVIWLGEFCLDIFLTWSYDSIFSFIVVGWTSISFFR